MENIIYYGRGKENKKNNQNFKMYFGISLAFFILIVLTFVWLAWPFDGESDIYDSSYFILGMALFQLVISSIIGFIKDKKTDVKYIEINRNDEIVVDGKIVSNQDRIAKVAFGRQEEMKVSLNGKLYPKSKITIYFFDENLELIEEFDVSCLNKERVNDICILLKRKWIEEVSLPMYLS